MPRPAAVGASRAADVRELLCPIGLPSKMSWLPRWPCCLCRGQVNPDARSPSLVAHQVGHALLPPVHCWSTVDARQVLRLQPMPRGHRVRLLTGPVKFIYVRVRLHIRDASSTSTEDTNVYEPCTTNIAKDRRVPLRWPSTPSSRPMPEQAPLAWIASSTSTDDPEHLRSLHDCEM